MMQQKGYDLVLCDINMPGMAGDELTKTFRDWEATKTPTRKEQPIVALSAYGLDARMRLRCEAAGMSGIVQKPMPQGAVNEILRAIEERHDRSQVFNVSMGPYRKIHLFTRG